MIRIVADENIPFVREAFGALGAITTLPGRTLRRDDLSTADVLLVRSVTRVDARLLEGTPVRFVASATIGFDHLDRDYLAGRGIPWATAPGCNATPAAEWVVAAVLHIAEQRKTALDGQRVGIIGCGNVGSRVRDRLTALGMTCVVNDPPRERAEPNAEAYVSLEDALDCDIVTLHVPLTREGEFPTAHLLNAGNLDRLRPGALLINAARGAVIDNRALRERLARGGLTAALDCWEGEPVIDVALLAACAIGSPHIAGYSLDGRVRGTEMIYRATCRWLGIEPTWHAGSVLPAITDCDIDLRGIVDPVSGVRRAVRHVYDITRDDSALRRMATLPADQRGAEFDRLRREYPLRREFAGYRALVDADATALIGRLAGLGFEVARA